MLRGLFGNIDITEFIGSGHSRLPVVHRLSRRADLQSFRTTFRPSELAARRPCRRAQLADDRDRQANSSSGGERYAHSQHGCKVSRNPGDSGKDRPGRCAWPPVGPIRKYLSAAPVDVSTANISFRVLAFGAVARIGCVCIAVLGVSGSLELRRRRIKSASQSWIWQSTFGRF